MKLRLSLLSISIIILIIGLVGLSTNLSKFNLIDEAFLLPDDCNTFAIFSAMIITGVIMSVIIILYRPIDRHYIKRPLSPCFNCNKIKPCALCDHGV